MEIRECLVSDYKNIYQLNKNTFGYDYDTEKYDKLNLIGK